MKITRKDYAAVMLFLLRMKRVHHDLFNDYSEAEAIAVQKAIDELINQANLELLAAEDDEG